MDPRAPPLLQLLETHELAQEVSARRRARIAQVLLARLGSLTVVMENVADPHNASAVMRTAEGLGVGVMHVVEQPNKWEKNRAIAKSADRWVEVVRHAGLARCLGDLSARGFTLYAADVGSGCTDVHDIDVTGPVALVFGSEHSGLSKRALALTDGRFTIPMHGFVESFNVSVSAALALYDLCTRRRALLPHAGDLPIEELKRLASLFLQRSVRDPHLARTPAARD